ncbi:hypothetical protein MED121_13220 [Marinomonas sp. MED121]|uniref:hypothetical protein n=1 Tax=Marinomonas sp. MED121 TaxID=314277 RepID=UPI000068FEA9|nr:hypothetical protein [Marinomonas sp. MED121]EAQ66890.1 hypothetical protein MED121_13220 [Marinomonas sp. MED121]
MKYFATGIVHPERAAVSFSKVGMKIEGGGEVVVQCDASQLTVSLDVPSLDGWIAAHITAEDIANIIVGALGFSLGCGYTVEIVQITEEDGTPHVFGVRPRGESPNEHLGFDPHIPTFNAAYRLAGRDVFFRLSVRDYLNAMTDTKDCATYCFRAIEGIKSSFNSWEDMHKALGTDRSEITELVKNYADPVRHGNWVSAPITNSKIRWKMLAITKNVLDKYLQYAGEYT